MKEFNHPLPLIDEIFVALSGGQKFTKLDFLNAYNQLEVDPEISFLMAFLRKTDYFLEPNLHVHFSKILSRKFC